MRNTNCQTALQSSFTKTIATPCSYRCDLSRWCAREEIGKSGFAHFFEHMMFQGSDHVADEQHFKIVTDAGGTLNGSTNRDRTNYYETVPSNQLEKMIWLEADRMGFLLDAVTQKKFEIPTQHSKK